MSKINPIFDTLIWFMGYIPTMRFKNGIEKELDVVAYTCLDSPLINKKTKNVNVVIKCPDFDDIHLNLTHPKYVSCSQLIDYVNDNSTYDDYKKIFSIYLKQNGDVYILVESGLLNEIMN